MRGCAHKNEDVHDHYCETWQYAKAADGVRGLASNHVHSLDIDVAGLGDKSPTVHDAGSLLRIYIYLR